MLKFLLYISTMCDILHGVRLFEDAKVPYIYVHILLKALLTLTLCGWGHGGLFRSYSFGRWILIVG